MIFIKGSMPDVIHFAMDNFSDIWARKTIHQLIGLPFDKQFQSNTHQSNKAQKGTYFIIRHTASSFTGRIIPSSTASRI
jgi:hypothetical protein